MRSRALEAFRSFTILIGVAVGVVATAHAGSRTPPVLSFDDLVALATIDPPPPKLAEKLTQVLTTPVIVNRFGASPDKHTNGGFLHVAEWNINRGENEEDVEMALSNAGRFLDLARKNPKMKHLARLRGELQDLQAADVVVLDEVDDGVDRTKYHDVARDLADALHMNYVYGVEFIELDRIYLGAEKMDQPEQPTANTGGKRFGLDPTRYRGLEGSAVLSRYPIRSARIVRLPQAYDWYHSEIKAISDLEKARRWSAEQLFEERIARQVRRGGRMALIVDLASPAGTITVICPHLEDYTSPRHRREQMQYLLQQCTTIANPAILAGDLNTTGKNGHPLTVERALFRYVLNYHVLIREVVFFITPIPGVGILLRAANYIKNYHDPTAFNLPIFLSNPSRPLFNQVRNFRFADGGSFDFSGSPERSFHKHARTLADSNQRGWKGFTPTFRFKRTFHNLVGEFKLDWIFVKPGPDGTGLVPSSGRTLHNLNYALGQRVSDHSPVTVVLSTSAPARALTPQ